LPAAPDLENDCVVLKLYVPPLNISESPTTKYFPMAEEKFKGLKMLPLLVDKPVGDT